MLTNGPLTYLLTELPPFEPLHFKVYICAAYSLKLLSSKRAARPRTLGLWRRGLTLAAILARQKPNHISFFSVKIYSGAAGQRFSLCGSVGKWPLHASKAGLIMKGSCGPICTLDALAVLGRGCMRFIHILNSI